MNANTTLIVVDHMGLPLAAVSRDGAPPVAVQWPDGCGDFQSLIQQGWCYGTSGWVSLGPRPPMAVPSLDKLRLGWVDAACAPGGEETLADARRAACAEVNRAAGECRKRFLSGGFGQVDTYAEKAQQAMSWAASDFQGAPPPYVAVEAADFDLDPIDVAKDIMAAQAMWAVLGPRIEAIRRRYKAAISSTGTVAGVLALPAAANREFDAVGDPE
jgi:hypothetical protein